MAVPSGTASMSDIQTEFGGSNPISMSEYYSANANIPSSGAISINDFRGESATDVDPNTFSYANISGTSSASTTDETISGHTGIDLYHTQTYYTGTLSTVDYRINSGTWITWSPGSGNVISISNNDTLGIRVSTVSGSVDVDINIYNASNSNAFEAGFNANVTDPK